MFMLMRMLVVGDPTGRSYNAYANGWGHNGEKLSSFVLIRMLVVGVPTGRSSQCL